MQTLYNQIAVNIRQLDRREHQTTRQVQTLDNQIDVDIRQLDRCRHQTLDKQFQEIILNIQVMTLDNLIDYTLDNLIGVDKNASFLFFIKVTSILLQVLSNSTSRVLEVYKNKCKTQKIVQKYNLKIKKKHFERVLQCVYDYGVCGGVNVYCRLCQMIRRFLFFSMYTGGGG